MDTTESRISRVELNLTEFRAEVREEFAAVRAEVRKEFAAVRAEIGEVKARIDAVQVTLSKEIQENHRVTLALFEQLKEQIKTMGEGMSRP
jgi:hypothetical protein